MTDFFTKLTFTNSSTEEPSVPELLAPIFESTGSSEECVIAAYSNLCGLKKKSSAVPLQQCRILPLPENMNSLSALCGQTKASPVIEKPSEEKYLDHAHKAEGLNRC
jgi:hypothetical protein